MSKTQQGIHIYETDDDGREPHITVYRAAKLAGINPTTLRAALLKRNGICQGCGRPLLGQP